MSNYGIVNTVLAQQLSDVGEFDLVEFEIDYVANIERISNINASRPQSQRIQPMSIRQWIKTKLIHILCIVGSIYSAQTVEKATDETV